MIVSVEDFGAIADDYSGHPGTDSTSAFLDAIRAGNRIFVPGYEGRGYKIDLITIDKRIEFFGDLNTEIVGSIRVIKDNCRLHDFLLRANWKAASDEINGDENGLEINSNRNFIYRVDVQNFSGNGFHVTGDVVQGTGNANLNVIRDCGSYCNGRAGIFFKSGDSNQCSIENFNSVGNGRFGIDEQSFLGNTYINSHTANNASGHPANKTIVSHNDKLYWALKNNVGIEPGSNEGSCWMPWGDGAIFSKWNKETEYFSGAGYHFGESPNQRGVLINAYSEGDELTVIGGTSSIAVGGFIADSGALPYIRVVNGDITFKNLQVENREENLRLVMWGKGYNLIGVYDLDNDHLIFGLKYDKEKKCFGIAQKNTFGGKISLGAF